MRKVKLLILLFAFGVICNVQGENLPGSGDVIHGPFSNKQSSGDVIHGPFSNKQSSGDVIHGPFSNKQKSKIKPLQAETDFYEIEPIQWKFTHNTIIDLSFSGKSNVNRLWYSFFPADDTPASKPLFVMLNGGPGCATSLNLFAMNTAPYTLDRNVMGDSVGQKYKKNDYSWTKLGNLLYIDAPNAGFSYMLSDVETKAGVIDLFTNGSNYNPFIDAAQVLRVVLRFLKEHPAIQQNEVIFVGESYSGVRVTTILNLLLNYENYGNGKRVYKDVELSKLIKEQLDSLPMENKKSYTYDDIAQQFGRQILIQPQIVDEYQTKDFIREMKPDNSLMQTLANEKGSKITWKDFKKKKGWKKDTGVAITMFMNLILDRDKYHYKKPWSWSDNNEEFAIKGLTNVDVLSKVTGCDIENVKYFSAKERKNSVRYLLKKDTDIFEYWVVRKFIDWKANPEVKMMLKLVPKREIRPVPAVNDPRSLTSVFGELNKYDSYMSGTNVYVFIGFMMGYGPLFNRDLYDVKPGSSKRYGKMFLDNISIVDTFMTDAKCDLVVYSPALPKQFDPAIGGRYNDIVKDVDSQRGRVEMNGTCTDGFIEIDFKPEFLVGKGSIKSNSRKIHWPHYETSGHSVSSTQPKKFRDDVEKWLQEATH